MTAEEAIAHEIALELAEATSADRKAWAWPDDFVGDVIDRARSAASRVVAAARLEALEEAAQVCDQWAENGDNYSIPTGIAAEIRALTKITP